MSQSHCKSCGSFSLKETLTPELRHYARLDCIDCGRFHSWVKNPETGGYSKELESLLVKARNIQPDNDFLKSLESQFAAKGFLSEKQKACLERMAQE